MKVTNNKKRLWGIAGAVTLLDVLMVSLSFIVTYPTGKHLDIARQMGAGPEKTNFDNLMGSPEANWTIYSGLGMMLLQLVVFAVAIYVVYRIIRQRRLVSNAAGVTTGIFVFASVIASIVGMGIDKLLNLQPLMYDNPGIIAVTLFMNMLVSFIFAFLIVLVVERIYNRKHSFAIE